MTAPDLDVTEPPLLRVRDLTVRFPTPDGLVYAVNGIDFDIQPGETLAIVGESGSGKSVTALAAMGLLPAGSQVTGSVELRGRQLIGLPRRQLRAIRGREIAMVFQDALTSLDPVFTVGAQIVEAIRAHHRDVDRDEARRRAIELLEIVGIGSPRQRIDAFPHQLSGGMRQRVMIAIAIANHPSLLIADEPTTALDVTIQAQVMAALEAARRATGAAMLLITHDLGLVAEYADRVHVMYGGVTFETAATDDLFATSRNPYTRGLLRSIPRTDQRLSRLQLIRGSPPNALAERLGCVFAPRCDDAAEICRQAEPDLQAVGPGHHSRCHFAATLGPSTAVAVGPGHRPVAGPQGAEPLLVVEHLVKQFAVQRGPLRKATGSVRAVNDVSLTIAAEESVGIVGESGSGKSTLARCILRMIEPTSGAVRFDGEDVLNADAAAMRTLRTRMQLVFQDPYASLNPRMTVAEIVAEPLRVHGWRRRDARRRVSELLDAVGLLAGSATRYPHEFSGGQRQRIGIARSLALRPRLLILDEPVSALDVSVQAQVLNMLDELQSEFEVAYMYIAHDLAVVRHVADRIGVMYLGELVEWADGDDLFGHPAHPYTQSLLAAVPVPDPASARQRKLVLGGDVPDPSRVPSGCPFHPRCPIARDRCREEAPAAAPIGDGHWARCHFPLRRGERLAGPVAS